MHRNTEPSESRERRGDIEETFDGDRMSHGWAEMWDPEALAEALQPRRRTEAGGNEPSEDR